MSVTINESGVTFGPFAEDSVFELERVLDDLRFGDYVCKVEFLLFQSGKNNRIGSVSFVEARSSVPRQSDSFFDEIYKKMTHSLTVWLCSLCGRHDVLQEKLPANLKGAHHAGLLIKLVLVVPTAPDDALSPLTDKLREKLRAEEVTWGIHHHNIMVVNEPRARRIGLIAENQ